jgi:methylthioribose-1-phosphate isomerase
MKVKGKHYRTVWMEGQSVFMIEQNKLPFTFEIMEYTDYKHVCNAIKTMVVRGAGAIGAAAGFAMAQAFLQGMNPEIAKQEIDITRPTARNLFYATQKVFEAGLQSPRKAVEMAQFLADENVEQARSIGIIGSELFKSGARILTHCNAGWLGFVDYGSALAPVYVGQEQGKSFLVYADETRPRSQGARLTAWELSQAEIPHVIIPDNAAAYLMAKGMIDAVIVGADRIASNGDTANKIGTLEKAIAANYYKIPFYVAAPSSTFDLNCPDGESIDIEQRTEKEVLYQTGPTKDGKMETILVCNPGSVALNPAFDVTPASLITRIITDKGILKPCKEEIFNIFENNK